MPDPDENKAAEEAQAAKDAEAAAAVAKDAETKTYDYKVAGEDRSATIAELLEKASKEDGADQKFRDASENLKASTSGRRVTELIGRVTGVATPNTDEVKELSKLMGVPLDKMATLLDNADPDPKKKPGEADPAPRGPVAYDDMDDEVQELLAATRQSQIKDAGDQIRSNVQNFVDKDKTFGKIVGSIRDNEKAEQLKSTINDMVFNDVQRKILASGQYGAEMVEESVQRIRAVLTKLGIPGKASEDPVLIGLGPSGMALPADVQADKPIDRVSAGDDDYEENAKKRLQQAMLKNHRRNVG